MRFYLCIGKWSLVPFSHCKCDAVAQTGDSVVLECYMHCALQGAQDRTALDKKNKGLWLGTLLKAINPGNTIEICVNSTAR